MKLYILISCMYLVVSIHKVKAQETNSFFVDGGDTNLQAVAVRNGECRPANFDPDGHWGALAGGFQMSVRTQTNVFTSDSPVPVTVNFRNTTTNSLTMLENQSRAALLLIVEDESGHALPVVPQKYDDTGFYLKPLAAKTQARYVYNLNEFYKFHPGSYKITAKKTITDYSSGSRRIAILLSGTMQIQIISK
jgi:hypothetical protein